MTSDDDEDVRDQVLENLTTAWNEALDTGAPRELVVSVALALAYGELVSLYGRETAQQIAARFPDQIRQGSFDLPADA